MFTGSWSARLHQLRISYTNDPYAVGCNRRLRVTRSRSAWRPCLDRDPVRSPVRAVLVRRRPRDSRGDGNGGFARAAPGSGERLLGVGVGRAAARDPAGRASRQRAPGRRSLRGRGTRGRATEPSYSLGAISSGAYDSEIGGWARAVAAYGKPLMLRFRARNERQLVPVVAWPFNYLSGTPVTAVVWFDFAIGGQGLAAGHLAGEPRCSPGGAGWVVRRGW